LQVPCGCKFNPIDIAGREARTRPEPHFLSVRSISCTVAAILRHLGVAMQDEAVITINGVKLSDAESMTVRVAIDTLANVLAEGLEEKEGQELTAVYMDSLVRIQGLLESREARKQ
jgi:hypothetical protein